MNELTHALNSMIAQAAKDFPVRTGAVEKCEQRWSSNTPGCVCILADVSGSMNEFAGTKRKIDHCQDALDDTMSRMPEAQIVAFSSSAADLRKVSSLGHGLGGRWWTLPPPGGGTAMHLALELARKHRPSLTVVISDGRPDDHTAALSAAEKISGRIDVIYCGPESDATAIAFMRRLARIGVGQVLVADLVSAGTGTGLRVGLRKLLALPRPKN